MGNVEKEMIIFVCGPSDYADTKSICGNLRYTLGYIQEKRHKKIKILLKRESGNFCDVVRDYAEANNIEIEEDSSKGDSFAKKIDLCVAFYKPKCGVDKEIQKVLQNEKIIHACLSLSFHWIIKLYPSQMAINAFFHYGTPSL